jgi:hypothetical protein
MLRRSPLKKAGKKTAEWNRERAKLKEGFQRAGITFCELGLQGCWKGNGLSFAHSKKRRNIQGNELSEVILACINCHGIIERKPEKKMTAIVRKTIRLRETPVEVT